MFTSVSQFYLNNDQRTPQMEMGRLIQCISPTIWYVGTKNRCLVLKANQNVTCPLRGSDILHYINIRIHLETIATQSRREDDIHPEEVTDQKSYIEISESIYPESVNGLRQLTTDWGSFRNRRQACPIFFIKINLSGPMEMCVAGSFIVPEAFKRSDFGITYLVLTSRTNFLKNTIRTLRPTPQSVERSSPRGRSTQTAISAKQYSSYGGNSIAMPNHPKQATSCAVRKRP